ncbi:hypothetical protein CsSME_00045388 [Camellia sinensis var. sinensis]
MKSATPNDGGGAIVPLLPKLKSPPLERPASVAGAVFNVSTSMVGTGIMSIPATIKVLGVIPTFVSIAMVAILVDVSVEFMMRFTNFGESSAYAGLIYESFGRFGSVAVQICILITSLGYLIIYQIIIGDVLSGTHLQGPVHLGILQEWFRIQRWNTRAFTLFFLHVGLRYASSGFDSSSRIAEVQFSGVDSTACGFCWHMFCYGNLCIVRRESKKS